MLELYLAEDSLPRCKWCSQVPEFLAYHDEEWGFPVADDRRLFEKSAWKVSSRDSVGAPSY